MCADHNIHPAGLQIGRRLFLLGAAFEPAEQIDAHGEFLQPLAERVVMLLGKDGGGHQISDLLTVLNCLEGRAQGNLGFPVAHVAADQTVHNAAAFGDHPASPEEIDFSRFAIPFNVNALGAIRLVQAFLPRMRGGLRRLCFVSSEAGSVSVAHRTEVSSYCMSKTALNMAIRLMFNHLQPEGYTFRVYHPGWVRSPRDHKPARGGKFEPWETAQAAVPQFIEDRDWEDRLVIIDNEGAAWPF